MAMTVYVTLDYELFMGSVVGTVDNCLIRPTEKLVEILDKYGVKASFFVDAAYLYRLHTLSIEFPILQEEHERIIRQLRWLVEKGHDIQLHIHPQWFSALYDGHAWHLRESDYKLSDFDDVTAFKLFNESKDHLEKSLGLRVCAFRAGGFSIQSFKSIKSLFESAGITVDSSVLCMRSSGEGPQFYDYSKVEPGHSYRFVVDVANQTEDGPFVELPITTGQIGVVPSIMGSIQYHLIRSDRKKRYGDGNPIACKRDSNKHRLIRRFNEWLLATFDSGGSQNLLRIFKRQRKVGEAFVILSHPKNLSASSLADLESFLRFAAPRSAFDVVSSLGNEN